MDPNASTTQIQQLLDRLQNGDDSARTALIEHSVGRFQVMAQRMFRQNSDLRQLEQTDDVLQKAMIRLHRALSQVKPPNVRAYVGLAARQIRWVLGDLAREAAALKGSPLTNTRMPNSVGESDAMDLSMEEPTDLLEWQDFHRAIESLPERERELFDLLLYQGMTQPEAATLLSVPLRTVKRHWQKARLNLHQALRGNWPSLNGDV